ncbi:hypothetical protein B6D60_11540 [candidate division KSB1 bacterium 4484_87]|nr:MAG: hypothetical protein B6D60_11540 [candidate division KSB1 bacterium 4484_87]
MCSSVPISFSFTRVSARVQRDNSVLFDVLSQNRFGNELHGLFQRDFLQIAKSCHRLITVDGV